VRPKICGLVLVEINRLALVERYGGSQIDKEISIIFVAPKAPRLFSIETKVRYFNKGSVFMPKKIFFEQFPNTLHKR